MPIDATVPQSPGWWLFRLATKLLQRRERIERLAAYYRGDPPLPTGADNAKEAYEAFVRKAPVTMFKPERIVFEAAVWQTYIGQGG